MRNWISWQWGVLLLIGRIRAKLVSAWTKSDDNHGRRSPTAFMVPRAYLELVPCKFLGHMIQNRFIRWKKCNYLKMTNEQDSLFIDYMFPKSLQPGTRSLNSWFLPRLRSKEKWKMRKQIRLLSRMSIRKGTDCVYRRMSRQEIWSPLHRLLEDFGAGVGLFEGNDESREKQRPCAKKVRAFTLRKSLTKLF